MITIEEVRVWIRGESKENLFDFALRAADLALSQHEEIERLRIQSRAWELMAKGNQTEAYERAAQVCEARCFGPEDGDDRSDVNAMNQEAKDCAQDIRKLRSGEPK